jgi:uncharacterized protein YukE
MSVIRGSIAAHQRLQLDRRRARMQAEEMWDDAAGRKYFDVLDGLERADREYDRALRALDTVLDQANRML